MSEVMRSIRRVALAKGKDLATTTDIGRRLVLPKYRYMFSPEQLWALCQVAETGLALGGAFAEIGCYDGSTTVYLHRHLQDKGELPPYYCLDTFSGFTEGDIAVERERGKTEDFKDVFYWNSKACFERTMELNGLSRVVVIRADATTFDYSSLPALSFALVDVDLMQPVRVAMAGCWERLVPGGMMVVDDCTKDIGGFDGALEAYTEFCRGKGLPVDIRHGKLGFATKPG